MTPATDEEIVNLRSEIIAHDARGCVRDSPNDCPFWQVRGLLARIDELEAEVEEARATKDMHKERQEEAWAEVESLKAENERLRRTNCTCLTARQKGESK